MSEAKPGERPLREVMRERPAELVAHQGPHDGRSSSNALFDVNSATEEELAFVDFIGPKAAHAIVEQRNQRGGFASWEELASVAGLDAKKVAELQRAASLTPPAR